MSEDAERIEHMLDRITYIQSMLSNVSQEEFFNSRVLLDAVSFNFAVLGEAANKLSKQLRSENADIPWGDIIGMRNILIHDYVKSEPIYMWDACKNNLEPLRKRLLAIKTHL